ncbi:MAG: helix-turn-helix domain-containing protein [Hyphomicrobiales bacterium]
MTFDDSIPDTPKMRPAPDDDRIPDSFPERLRAARELRKWSQEELAERAATHASSIAHYEIGSRKPSFEALYRIANCLEITTDYLLGRVEFPGLAEVGDPLFQSLEKLTGEDRELAKSFLKMLAGRRVGARDEAAAG